MVSLWGSKNGEQNEEEQDDSQPQSTSHSQQPRQSEDANERTRLLHPPPHAPNRGDGYLDPNDPAVSPYNLWSVRALRYFEVLFLMITCLWWVLLFISIFISPPQMHSRGSGFFDVSYATLTIGNLLIALLFFATPSTPMGVLSLATSVLLIVDMIIIVAVGRLRVEEGWVGIASVVWAAVIGLYNVLANRTVRWGKKAEEERLTGRAETKRSLREWFGVFAATFLMVIIFLVTILLTATLILRARDASLAPPGKRYFVDGDKYQIHLACVGEEEHNGAGEKMPTVMLEGGYMPVEYTFEDWVYDAHQNGTIGRYCYWDRPGLGWSDNAPSPHSASMSADALSEALAVAGETGPWILVSAGIGGIYSRVFSARHPKDIAGMMLIDALHEDLLYKIASPNRGFFLWAWGIISPLGLDRNAGALFKGRTKEDRVYGRSAHQGGKFIKNKLQENLVADSLTKNEVVSARAIQEQTVPLVVVTSGIHLKQDKDWQRKQKDLTNVTDNLLAWDIVNKAPKEEVWKDAEGKMLLEKRLGQLYRGRASK